MGSVVTLLLWLFVASVGAKETEVYYWSTTEHGVLPCSDYVRGGISEDYKDLFTVGRFYHGFNMLPCLVETSANVSEPAVTVFEGDVYRAATDYQVLCGTGLAWKPILNATSTTELPGNSLQAGFYVTGQVLYICRVYHGDHESAGYVEPESKQCLVYTQSRLEHCSYEPNYDIVISLF